MQLKAPGYGGFFVFWHEKAISIPKDISGRRKPKEEIPTQRRRGAKFLFDIFSFYKIYYIQNSKNLESITI
jgi:hypothetical protein